MTADLEPRSPTQSRQSSSPGLDLWQVAAVVRSAIAAPSPRDSRPWRLRVDGRKVTVALDTERLAIHQPVSDRAAHVSAGALVLDVAAWAASVGMVAEVTWLPDGAHVRSALAEIHLAPTLSPDRVLAELGSQVTARRVMRATPRTRRVGPPVRARLGEAAASHDATLSTVDQSRRQRLLDLVRHDDAERGLVAPDAAHRRGGPELMVLSTAGDRPVDWMRAGAALQETWLTATGYGAAMTIVDGPIEDDTIRARLRSDLGHSTWPQVILRAGYGPSEPSVPAEQPWRSFLDRSPP
ncbi:MAG: hypothetical protein Q7T56_09175 [Nocardioidaceae bacterium]|nr:hypothetical protein [Nocardioidaceae bacterium]